jgi:hypothetical protein
MYVELSHLVGATDQPKELSFGGLKRRIRHHIQQANMKGSNGLMRGSFFRQYCFTLFFKAVKRREV